MQWFIDSKTRTKLLSGFGLIALLMAVLIAVAAAGMRDVTRIQDLARMAVQVETGLNANRSTVLYMLGEEDPTALRALQSEVRAQREEDDRLLAGLRTVAAATGLPDLVQR